MVVWSVVATVLLVFIVLMFVRLVFDYVFLLARGFRPSGALTVLLEAVYTVTDPPIKAVRRVIPPLRLGGVSLDLGFFVVLVVAYVLRGIAVANS